MTLRSDPSSLAPERLLVFEVQGPIANLATAVRNVPGLELVDEDEFGSSDDDKDVSAYLMVPDVRALQNLESLWQRWRAGKLVTGESPWREVFTHLRDLRAWGPADRLSADEAETLREEIDGKDEAARIRLEIELVYRPSDVVADAQERELLRMLAATGGRLIARSRLPGIAYHALLAEFTVTAVRKVIEQTSEVVTADSVMHIQPQSVADRLEVSTLAETLPTEGSPVRRDPILAILDGVPIAQHPILASHLDVDDPFDLERATPAEDRVHGTAMASLIAHGDLTRNERVPLPRRLLAIPITGAKDELPQDQLVVDMVYRAVQRLRGGNDPVGPGVIIINLSMGNSRRRFQGHMSPWARVLDLLAFEHGILFVVSAGNCRERIGLRAYARHTDYEDDNAAARAHATARAVGAAMGVRRLFSPAETVNGVTVGALNERGTPRAPGARVNVNPYDGHRMSNPSSALGPGFARSVKPEILLPGSIELLRFNSTTPHLHVVPAAPSREGGLRVASPVHAMGNTAYTGGTSAAAALASRTAHRIHDVLEEAYETEFTALGPRARAVLLKALLIHTAQWPREAAELLGAALGPPGPRHHVRRKDNIRRFLGYGAIDESAAVECASDRATLWATGELGPEQMEVIKIPLPAPMAGVRKPHSLAATLAWFTPTMPGRQSYRQVRMKLLEPENDKLKELEVKPESHQPDTRQSSRGTVFCRVWSGNRAPSFKDDGTLILRVQRDPDMSGQIDEKVPYGVAITLAMPGVAGIYESVQARSEVRPPVRPRVRSRPR